MLSLNINAAPMALTPAQQVYEALKKSQSTLITFRPDHDGDAIGCALALSRLLQKMEKPHEIASHGFVVPQTYKFLPGSETIKDRASTLQRLVISLDISQHKVKNLNYNVDGDKLHIHIEPENGRLGDEHISTRHADFKHDLIICLNSPDLESLQGLYHENPDFFYHTPILNIDHAADNEHFGHYNIVNVTASSTAEIVHDLIHEIDPRLIDEHLATCLLTGMIVKTKSFKTADVTPKSLQIASQLVACGAQRDHIIKNLYHTKSIETLQLWGKMLQNIRTTDDNRVAWIDLTASRDAVTLKQQGSLPGLIDEIIFNMPSIEYVAILYQDDQKFLTFVSTEKNTDLRQVFKHLKPEGEKRSVTIRSTAEEQQQILETLKKIGK